MNPPLLSVLLPAYNAEKTIRDSVNSILSQSFTDFELLVIDDGSSDKTYAELCRFQDPRLRVIRRDNRGLSASLNELLAIAKGVLVARMDADDISLPTRFELQVEAFSRHPEFVLVGGQIEFLVSEITFPGPWMPTDHDEILSNLLTKRFSLCHPSVMFKRDAALKVGSYRIQGPGEDLDFFLRIAEVGRIFNAPEIVLQYRMSLESLSTSKHKELAKSYAFAIENANRRANKSAEVTLEEFSSIWDVGILNRMHEWSARNSELLYRKHFLCLTQGRPVAAYMQLCLAALFRPKRTLRRLITEVRRIMSTRHRNNIANHKSPPQ